MKIVIGQEIYNTTLNLSGIVLEVGRQFVVVKCKSGSVKQWIKSNCEVVEYESV